MNQFLIQGLRLNRTTAIALLSSVLLNQVLLGRLPAELMEWVFFGFNTLIAVMMLGITQGTLRLAKQLPEGDNLESDKLGVEKISVLLCLGAMSVCSIVYLLGGGHLNSLMLCLMPVLLSHLLGLTRVNRILSVWFLVLSFGTFALGYPTIVVPDASKTVTTVALAGGLFNTFGFFTVLALLPFIVSLFHFSMVICHSVRNISTRAERLQSLAATDALTGLINRRQFNHRLFAEISRARRHHIPLSLALFDIDNFKHINDFYGHQTGDRILKELGQLIAENVRDCDIPARYGGEEFALILPETRLGEAQDLLERLRGLVARHVFCLPDNPLPVTISVGVSQLDPENHTAFELVEQTDTALYEAKNQGKNRVVIGVTAKSKLPPIGQPRKR